MCAKLLLIDLKHINCRITDLDVPNTAFRVNNQNGRRVTYIPKITPPDTGVR